MEWSQSFVLLPCRLRLFPFLLFSRKQQFESSAAVRVGRLWSIQMGLLAKSGARLGRRREPLSSSNAIPLPPPPLAPPIGDNAATAPGA